jgi:hypothetical protein
MTTIGTVLGQLSDRELLSEVKRLARDERQATARLIAALAELDARRLYLGEGCSSLFTYCTQILFLSEHAAYHRIEAARAARRFPLVLDRLVTGDVTLTAIGLLAPHLTADNHRELLDAAYHKSKRDVQHLLAALQPRPDVPCAVRKLPALRSSAGASLGESTAQAAPPCAGQVAPPTLHRQPASAADGAADVRHPAAAREATADVAAPLAATLPGSPMPTLAPVASRPSRKPPHPTVVAPLAPERYKVQMTIGAETHAKLRRAQDLLRHSIPDGDPAAVLDRALTVLLEHLEKMKLAATKPPRGATSSAPPRPDSPAGGHSRGHEQQGTEAPVVTGPPPDASSTRPRSATRSRHIPAVVKRAVWARDGGQCAFVGAEGRCRERGFLEFHHRVPFAAGGASTMENLALACRAHNSHETARDFGSSHWQFATDHTDAASTNPPTRSGPS